ncbi:VCBS repeat-containing protein [Gammaproteobacteria bacterium]|nr:VCBS repeat-containing protein [Gammaproteobacteria bacterium]MDA7844715.1 VCBS repeat-containing protein [Gammaproteobacteria bacterium]
MNKLKFLKKIFPVFILPILISCGGGGGGGDPTPAPIPTYTITASAGDNGAISPTSVTVNEGQTASFNISPDNGYIVSSASGCNGTLTDNTFITGSITSSCSITVLFVKYISTVFDTTGYELPYPNDLFSGLCEESVPIFTSILSPVDINLDSYNDLIVHYWCGPKEFGVYIDTPVPDAVVAFKNNGDETFTIANSEVFGQEALSFGAASRKVVEADFNGDGYLDILYALNKEDGRAQAGDAGGASNESPQNILLSNGDGTYALADLGFSEWVHAVDAAQLPSGNFDAVISGFRSPDVRGFRYEGQAFQSVTDYSSPGGPVNRFGASTLKFLPEYTIGSGSTLAISDSGDCGIQVNLSSFSKASGEWLFSDKTDFNCRTIQNAYESYTGEVGDLPLVTIDGQDYTGGGFGNDESCALELSPGDRPVAVVKYSAQPIAGNYEEGVVYKQGELTVENKINIFEVSDSGLALKTGVIEGHDVSTLFTFGACRDVNNDGYDDLVLLQNAGGGGEATNTRNKPIVYLNDKENHLVKMDLEGIPEIPVGDNNFDYLIHGFLADMNGDSIEDLVYYRAARSFIDSNGTLDPDMTNLIRIYLGRKNLQ